MNNFVELGTQIGGIVQQKNAAYGSSFAKAGDFLTLLYPNGLRPEQYKDALLLVRIFDKQMRVATDRDALGESPYADIAGYGILGTHTHQQKEERATWQGNANGPDAPSSSKAPAASAAPPTKATTTTSASATAEPAPSAAPGSCSAARDSAAASTASEAASQSEAANRYNQILHLSQSREHWKLRNQAHLCAVCQSRMEQADCMHACQLAAQGVLCVFCTRACYRFASAFIARHAFLGVHHDAF